MLKGDEMKIKSQSKKALALLSVAVFSVVVISGVLTHVESSTYAAQQIDVESTVTAQMNEDPTNKRIGVDPRMYSLSMSFKVPDTARSGDFFTISTNAVPDLSMAEIKTANGDNIGSLTKISCEQSIRYIQNSVSDAVFQTLKPENGPGRCEYKVIFNDSVDNANDVSFVLNYRNAYVGGFAIVNREYEYTSHIKVNGETKWSDTFTVSKWPKSTPNDRAFLWPNRVVFDTSNTDEGPMYIGFNLGGNLTGKVVEIELEEGVPILFNHTDNINWRSSNFVYNDNSRENPHGVISNGAGNLKWRGELMDSSNMKVAFRIEQVGQSMSSGFELKSMLNKKVLSEMNYKDGDKLKVSYIARIKDGDNVISEQRLEQDVNIIGRESLADLIRLQPPKPAEEIPAQPKEQPQPKQPQIQTPNTGFATPQTFLLPLFGILTAGTYLFIRKK